VGGALEARVVPTDRSFPSDVPCGVSGFAKIFGIVPNPFTSGGRGRLTLKSWEVIREV